MNDMSRFPAPVQVVVPAFGGSSAQRLSIPDDAEFEAVSIGPQSEVHQCFVITNGKQFPAPRALTGTGNVQNRIFTDPNIIKVGHQSPWVGALRGPIFAANYLAANTYNAIEGHLNSTTIPLTLELLFHRKAPFSWPRCRPDSVYSQYHADLVGTAASSSLLLAPGGGRKEQLLSISLRAAITGGTVTIRVYGRANNGLVEGTYLIDTLLDTIVLDSTTTPGLAAGELSYEYEGKFDFYDVRVQTASVTGAATVPLFVSLAQRD